MVIRGSRLLNRAGITALVVALVSWPVAELTSSGVLNWLSSSALTAALVMMMLPVFVEARKHEAMVIYAAITLAFMLLVAIACGVIWVLT